MSLSCSSWFFLGWSPRPPFAEHSVTHKGEAGSEGRLVLIVDFLHPDLEGKHGEHYVGREPPRE